MKRTKKTNLIALRSTVAVKDMQRELTGAEVKALRLYLGLVQAEFVEALGFGYVEQMSLIENGAMAMPFELKFKIVAHGLLKHLPAALAEREQKLQAALQRSKTAPTEKSA